MPLNPPPIKAQGRHLLAYDVAPKHAKMAADLQRALGMYNEERQPATAREVLFSRHLGQLKQGLAGIHQLQGPEDWASASPNICSHLAQANMHDYHVNTTVKSAPTGLQMAS